jgi:hypothetical protein
VNYEYESNVEAEIEGKLFEVSALSSTDADFMPEKYQSLRFRVNKEFMQSFECTDNLTAFLQTKIYNDGQVVGSLLYENFGTHEHQVNFY